MTGFDIGDLGSLGPQLVGQSPVGQSPAPTRRADEPLIQSDDFVGGSGGDDDPFVAVLSDALSEVNTLTNDVKVRAEGLARGEPVEVHDLMVAMGKSEVAFNLMLEIRNKVLEAWQRLQQSSV
ncbi:MAG: flagellar hook-basal body complex protein FliE [Planctomycetota bacterium]